MKWQVREEGSPTPAVTLDKSSASVICQMGQGPVCRAWELNPLDTERCKPRYGWQNVTSLAGVTGPCGFRQEGGLEGVRVSVRPVCP